MNWFFIALGAPFLWALVNIADNYLIEKFSNKEIERSSGPLALFASAVGIMFAIGILIFTHGVFDIPFFDQILLIVSGCLTLVWILLYLFALETEDTSSVVPWFLTIPIFGYILGYLFLGEHLAMHQIIGSLIILGGLVFITLDHSGEKKKFKHKPVLYMVCACLSVALSGILFKYVTVGNNFWVSSFWEYFGLGLAGALVYAVVPQYRQSFHHMARSGGRMLFFVNIITECMSVAGNVLTNVALIMAPVTMVYLVGSFQPAIVLVFTVLGTIFFPRIIKENISKKILIPKVCALVIMIIGTLILFI